MMDAGKPIDAHAAELAARLQWEHPPFDQIVVYGSSTVRLWTGVAGSLGRNDVLAIGFGGATLGDCVRHYGMLVRPLRPRLLVVAAGTNDIEQDGADADTIWRLVEQLAATARHTQPALPLAILTLKPAPYHHARLPAIRAANALLAERLPGLGAASLVDSFSPFMTANGEVDRRYYTDDQRHLNEKGYALWAGAIAAALPPPSGVFTSSAAGAA